MSNELTVPRRALPTVRDENMIPNVPALYTGGPVDSMLTRWRADRSAKAINALTVQQQAQAGLFDAHTAVVESTLKRQEALFRLQELPERLGHELALRRIDRAESFRQAQHRTEINEVTRQKENTHAQAELIHARTVLTDAEQQFKAQRDHGYLNYELMHKKKALELLDVQLSEAERRALFERHTTREEPELTVDADDIDDALYARREQLNAAGLDTSRIDAAIRSRKK